MIRPRPIIVFTQNIPNFLKKQVQIIASSDLSNNFQRNFLSNDNCLQVIKHFKICNFNEFYIHKTQQEEPFLFKCISSITFPILTHLFLENVRISNFEALQWMICPNLKYLYLMQNSAISIKPLAKTKFSFIAKIELDYTINHQQMRHLERMKLNRNTQVRNCEQKRRYRYNMNKKGTSLIEFMLKMQSKNFIIDEQSNIRSIQRLKNMVSQRNKKSKQKSN